MFDADRDDEELLARAREGDAAAFAVLVHRHAATLHAAATATSGAADPTSDAATDATDATDAAGGLGDRTSALTTVRRTFLRAMRRLDRADPADVEGWLLELQRTPLDEDAAAHAAPLANADLDELWRELAPCWPRGLRRRRLPRWVAQVALVLVLLALAVAVPYALLITAVEEADNGPEPIAEVVAVPVDDDRFDLTFEDAPRDADVVEGEDVADAPAPDEDGSGGEEDDGSGDADDSNAGGDADGDVDGGVEADADGEEP